MNYYSEIKDILIKNEVSRKVREYYANKNDLSTYYEVGKLLSEAGKHYGEGVIKEYAARLTIELGKGYSQRNLRNMRQFYKVSEKWQTLSAKLSWSHLCEILWFDEKKYFYYVKIIEEQNLSIRQLRDKIRSNEYERLPECTKAKLINRAKLEVTDFIKDPIILNKKQDYNKISELALKEIIMNDLDNFLNQLGSGFCYIGNEYKIRIGNSFNYIDILLFNIIFNCYVVVELKINKLTKQDIGQIMIYMNYVDERVKMINQDKTIGIIVCKENDKYLIKYSSDSRIHAITYELV